MELRRAGRAVHIRPKVFDLLLMLVEHRDRTVAKDELLDALWADQAVSDTVLTTCIRDARQVVGDSGTEQRVIQTVHGRGYRFVAEVREVASVDGGSGAAQSSDAADGEDAQAQRSESDDAWLSTPVPGGATSEHKTVSVLCCELTEADALMAQLGPESTHGLRQRLQRLAQEVLAEYGGTLFRVLDHGFVALFGAPVALEDHAYRALAAAVRLRERAGELQPGRRPGDDALGDLTVDLAMGGHCGGLLVGTGGRAGEETITAVGDTFRLAEELCHGAAGGALLLSGALDAALGDQVRTRSVTFGPRGLAEAREFLSLDTPPGRRSLTTLEDSHGLTPFVGRALELSLLDALWQRAAIRSRGQVVGLVGEAGVGKSRLLFEFCTRLGRAGTTVLAGQCLAYGQVTPYLPLAQLLRTACDIAEGESATVSDDKLRRKVEQAGLCWDEGSRRLLLEALHIAGTVEPSTEDDDHEPVRRRERAFSLLKDLLIGLASRQPLVVVVENVHWIDATSNEWIAQLVGSLAGAEMLVIATYRPGYRPAWIDKSYATQQVVPPLGDDDSGELVRRAAGSRGMDGDVLRRIVRKAEGNPLFLEECTHSALDHEGGPLGGGVPDSLQALLTARIDRLPPTAKHTLLVAAVVGHDVPLALLQGVTGLSSGAIERSVRALEAAELLFEGGLPASASTDARKYGFRHALTRDAAYALIMTDDRRQLHQRVAETLSAHLPEVVEGQPELLAHHFTEAGLATRAVPMWQRAAELATERLATTEALNHVDRALGCLDLVPSGAERDELELQLRRRISRLLQISQSPSSPEAVHNAALLQDLSQRLGEASQPLVPQFMMAFIGGRFHEARVLAERILETGRSQTESAFSTYGHAAMGYAVLSLGEFELARQHFDEAIASHKPEVHDYIRVLQSFDPAVAALSEPVMWWLGYPEQSKSRSLEAVALARRLGDPFSMGMALYFSAFASCLYGDAAEAERWGREAADVSAEHGFALWAGGAKFCRGWAQVQTGDADGGLVLMRAGAAEWASTGANCGRSVFMSLEAQVLLELRRFDDVAEVINRAFAFVDEHDETFYLAELHRLRGRLLVGHGGDAQEAERAFTQALDVARSQKTKALELRAAISAARHWQIHGKSEAARSLLGEVHGWFTEGFDTPDLVEARRLLDAWK